LEKNDIFDFEEENQTLKYYAATSGGSSGAPVFNNYWRIIGIHYGTLELAIQPEKKTNLGYAIQPVLNWFNKAIGL